MAEIVAEFVDLEERTNINSLSAAAPETSTSKGHDEQTQGNNREMVAMLIILLRLQQQVNRRKQTLVQPDGKTRTRWTYGVQKVL